MKDAALLDLKQKVKVEKILRDLSEKDNLENYQGKWKNFTHTKLGVFPGENLWDSEKEAKEASNKWVDKCRRLGIVTGKQIGRAHV